MSVAVDIADLAAAIERQIGWCYVLSVGDDERVKVISAKPTWDGDALRFGVGRGTVRNVVARAALTLAFPPVAADGMTLLVDGVAAPVGDDSISFRATSAILHRPAPG